jgi:hypothetical protein
MNVFARLGRAPMVLALVSLALVGAPSLGTSAAQAAPAATPHTSSQTWLFSYPASPSGPWQSPTNISVYPSAGSTGTLSYSNPFVVARDNNNHLWAFTNSGSAWSPTDITVNGNPAGLTIASDPETLYGVAWARDPNGHLLRFAYVQGIWQAQDLSVPENVYMTGDPSPMGDPTGKTEGAYVRDTSGNLQLISITTGGTWQPTNITKLASAPTIASNPYTDNTGVVYARGTTNDLLQFFINSSGQWVYFDVTTATGQSVAGDPVTAGGVTYSRNAAGHLLQFFVSNGRWVYFDVTAAVGGLTIAGDPTTYNGNEFGRTAAGHLVEFYVSNSQWTTRDITTDTGTSIDADPVATPIGVLAS